jgi:hypothetical protein
MNTSETNPSYIFRSQHPFSLSGLSRLLIVVAIATSGLAMNTKWQSLPDLLRNALGSNISFAQLPLSFIPNTGQFDEDVRFLARGMGGTLFFTPDQVTMVLPAGVDQSSGRTPPQLFERTVRLTFLGSNPEPQLEGSAQQQGLANYYLGDDPARWHTGLPTFSSVLYRQIYPGIDLRYDGNEGVLKGTYTLAPGADPGVIRWHYEGASGLYIDPGAGDLVISLVNEENATEIEGTLIERAPRAWQIIGGEQVPVEVRYSLSRSADRIHPMASFALGTYDASLPLIIDPELIYSTFLGGTSSDQGNGIAVNSVGNVYLTGSTSSGSFPGAPGAGTGTEDVFVTKINAAGSAVVYTTILAGNAADRGRAIAVDNTGNAYLTGSTQSANFPTLNPVQDQLLGSSDMFVARLNTAGSLVYSTYFGTDNFGYEGGEGIAVDNAGNAIITGEISSNVAIAKFNPAGVLVYEGMFGGSRGDEGLAIAVDSAGNAYITGKTESEDFPVENAFQASCGKDGEFCTVDAFVAKVDAAGEYLLYSTYLGGSGSDEGKGIALDGAGNIYVVGSTGSQDFPGTSPIQPNCNISDGYCNEAFVAKLKADGSALIYRTYLGGSKDEWANSVAVDTAGNAYVAGVTNSPNFPVLNAAQPVFGGGICHPSQITFRFCYDAFVVKINPAGSALLFSTYLGGDKDDYGNAIALDSSGNAYVTGSTSSSNFPVANALQATHGGPASDAFIAKIGAGSGGDPPPGPQPTQPPAYGHKAYIPIAIRGK